MRYDSIIIGGGPAGLAAASKLSSYGHRVALIERTDRLGGIPIQCIHPGFGIHYFHEDLTGPEFVYRFIDKLDRKLVDVYLESYVDKIIVPDPMLKKVKIISPSEVKILEAPTIIYAAGARERHRYEVQIPGSNVAGVYTAGEAQAMLDLYGILPGRKALIVGSGDVGLIMARRLVLEGVEVVGVVEILPYPGGLMRNIVQCLQDYGIPLYLSHALIEIRGKERVREAVIAKVDEHFQPIPGTEKIFEVDTVITAVGLRPRIKLLEEIGVVIDPRTGGPVVNDYLETSIPGIFVAGNSLVINDYVDYAVIQAEEAAYSAHKYIVEEGLPSHEWHRMVPGNGVRLVVPQLLSGERDVWIYMRVSRPYDKPLIVFRGMNKKLRLPRARPPEMIRLRLRSKEIKEGEPEIRVEVSVET